MNQSLADRQYMTEAIQLARKGLYTTDPNPRVGCVLVKDGAVVGRGFHLRAGQGHAEVNALHQAGDNAQGATAYVTLEPCSHFGKTPPCADALIRAGVKRVVAAMQDPNPQVAGQGLERIAAAGIEVTSGVLEEEARQLNPGFIKRMETGMPFVRVKMAMSLDGRTAMQSGESQWITGAAARSDVQKLRARSSAIISGSGSILLDNASLTLREAELGLDNAAEVVKRQPLRVVLDSQGAISPSAKVFQPPSRTLWVTNEATSYFDCSANITQLNHFSLTGESSSEGQVDLKALLAYLAEQENSNEVLVETGAKLAGSFVQQGLVDELVVYMAPKLLGSSARPLLDLPLDKMAEAYPLILKDQRFVGEDIRLTYRFDQRRTT